MSNEMVQHSFPVARYAEDEKTWGDVVTAASYLPYVTLYGGNSTACKEGKIGIGRYGLVRAKDSIEDLTASFDCLAIGWRFKAMKVADGNIVQSFDPRSQTFLTLKEQAAIKDSGCMYGIEFLLWVPAMPAKCYATFFCNNKTARREAMNIRAFCPAPAQVVNDVVLKPEQGPRAMTFKSQLIKSNSYVWHGPICTPCATQFEIPPMEEMVEQATKFANPPEPKVEVVGASAPGRDR